jgi:hypothetical protein
MGVTSSLSSRGCRSLHCLLERESCPSSPLSNLSLLLQRTKRQRQRQREFSIALPLGFAPKRETEMAKASSECIPSTSEEVASASSAGNSLRKGLGSFLSFLFFSFSFLSLLDLESFGIILS